jgi:hypothetical protein
MKTNIMDGFNEGTKGHGSLMMAPPKSFDGGTIIRTPVGMSKLHMDNVVFMKHKGLHNIFEKSPRWHDG